MSQNNIAYSTSKDEPSEKKVVDKANQKKVRGPKFTPPQVYRTPKGTNFSSWCQSIDAQTKHLNMIKEEAMKCASSRGYTPKTDIGKRFQSFFDEETLEAKRRLKYKKKRKKNVEKN